MKPFDLEAFKLGKPAVTRDGREAKFLAYEPSFTSSDQVLVKVDGYQNALEYSIEGHYRDCLSVGQLDLFMPSKKRKEGWVITFGSESQYVSTEIYLTLGMAEDEARAFLRPQVHRIEIEE